MKKLVFAAVLFFYSAPAMAQNVTVPVNVGIGPTFNWVTGPVADDQTFHFGFRFQTFVAIDQRTRVKYIKYIPKQYRKIARQPGEIRVDPVPWYVPRSFIISPKVRNTGMYGLTFRPLGLGISLGRDLKLAGGLLLTYAFIHSDTLESPMHFLRPGAELKADFEIPLQKKKKTMLSVGWASQFYIPQTIGGNIDEVGGIDNSIWHIGQIIVMFHKRFDYTFNIKKYL